MTGLVRRIPKAPGRPGAPGVEPAVTTSDRRLVVVFGWISGGGALRSTVAVVRGARDRFASVVAISCLDECQFDGVLDEAVDRRIRLDERRSMTGVFRAARRLARHLENSDVVLLVGRPALVIAGLAPRLKGRRVAVLHSDATNDRDGLRSRLEDRAVRRALAHATVVAVSEVAAQSAVTTGLVRTRPRVVSNPTTKIEAPLVEPRRGTLDRVTVAMVACIHPVKRIPDLIDLVAAEPERFESVRFIIAGDGPDRPRLDAAARRAAAVGISVDVLGYVDDPWSVYDSSDVVAIPSAAEGACLVRYEAWQRGRPVVAIPLGVFDPMEGPMLLTSFDAAGWAAAFERIRTDPELRAAAFRNGPDAGQSDMTADWLALLDR